MNIFLMVLILLICGGAYYEHTVDAQKQADDQQQIDHQAAQITSLQADKDKLTSDNATLTSQLAAAVAKSVTVAPAPAAAPAAAAVAATPPAPGAPPAAAAPAAPAAGAKVTADQMSLGVVVIKGDNAEGTGFIIKTANGPMVVTNLHVLANNPNVKIQTSSGAQITPTAMKGASDRDLAMLSIPDGNYTYLTTAPDVSKAAQAGDEVITPGNSQGGDVVLSTKGKMVALGPDRIEFDNPIYHGNSGGPVFHTASGMVLAVVTEAMKVDTTDDLDKTSFASRNSAIASSVRYFGLRLDNVPKWDDYNLAVFQNQTAFLDKFDQQSRALDSYLNYDDKNSKPGDSDAELYESDDKIMTAHRDFRSKLNGADTASQIDALRQLGFDLDSIADKDMQAIQNLDNFYTYEQQRARDAIAYRKALKDEIQKFTSDINRIGSLPRTQ